MSKSRAFTVIFASLLFGAILYQNCGPQGPQDLSPGNLNSLATPTPTPPLQQSATITVVLSNSAVGVVNQTSFNYVDTIFQKIKGLGPQGKGCAEVVGQSDGFCPNASVDLATVAGWAYSAGTDEWTSQMSSRDLHGRQVKMFYIRPSDSQFQTTTISVQSIAAATTNEVMVFASRDAAGLNVIGETRTSLAFFSHVKNGTAADFVCIYMTRNPNGTPNNTNQCSGTVPPNAAWTALPAETATDNNNTMLTYGAAAGVFHVTDLNYYIFKGGQKFGPFLIRLTPP